MRIHEQVDTTASPERVWELLADLSIHGMWNPHIVDTQLWDSGAAAIGTRYRVTYELSGRRSEYDAAIVELVPAQRFVARLEERMKGDGANFQRYMIETYTITPHGHGARVVHDVAIHHDGIPWYWRALIWLIQTTGHPVGKTIMQQFAELAERGGPASTRAARSG